MASVCPQCKVHINDTDTEFIVCESCKCKYHYSCSGQRLTTIQQKSGDAKARWRCAKCPKEVIKKTNTSAPTTPDPLWESQSPVLRQILEKVNKIDAMAEDVKELKVSVQFMSERYDELLKEVQSLKKINEENKRDITRLKNENQHLYRLVKMAD